MSKTLSKILVLCALIIICPLMIVGTAFASFYSVDATIVVDVYAGESTYTDAFANVKYKGDADTKLTITESHLKEITLKTLSSGYDFIGWYEGTVEDYTSDSNAMPISTDESLKVKMTDYTNLVAVYQIKSYNVTWNYLESPVAEVATNVKPSDAKDVYYWGDTLPVLQYDDYTFKGWSVDGATETFKKIKLETSGNVTLNALQSSWVEDEEVVINYYDVAGEKIDGASKTIYKGKSFNVSDVEVPFGTLVPGYSYLWKHGNETIDGEINVAKDYEGETYDIYLNATPVVYTLNVSSEDATYKNSTEVKFTVENTAELEKLFDAENWRLPYSFYEFAGISFNETQYTNDTIEDMVNAILSTSPFESTEVEVKANLYKYYTTISANSIQYKTIAGSNSSGLDNVYEAEGNVIVEHSGSADSSKTLNHLIFRVDDSLYDCDGTELEISSVCVRINAGGRKIEIIGVTAEMTINEFIEKLVKSFGKNMPAKTNTLTISEIVVRFRPIS